MSILQLLKPIWLELAPLSGSSILTDASQYKNCRAPLNRQNVLFLVQSLLHEEFDQRMNKHNSESQHKEKLLRWFTPDYDLY